MSFEHEGAVWHCRATQPPAPANLTRTGAVAPPAGPSALAGSLMSRSRIRLGWTDNAADETGFRIERSVDTKGRFAPLASLGANATTYTDKTAKAGHVYRYRVRAFNAAGSSAWSNTVTVKS